MRDIWCNLTTFFHIQRKQEKTTGKDGPIHSGPIPTVPTHEHTTWEGKHVCKASD